jgi:hypothetical protein
MFFMQSLGGAIFMCISQALFTNYITASLASIPGVDMARIQKMGAMDLARVVPEDRLGEVLGWYNVGLRSAFIVVVVVAVSCLMVLPALGMEWRFVNTEREGVNGKEGWRSQREKADAVVEGGSGRRVISPLICLVGLGSEFPVYRTG